ncbi:hypothetical protein PPERSA_00819 [Pseudocohnilembus persalinus]|uniref:Uncharacterized protein n=1 Tax=Pseudocohnilembus persalinus TaxID=266149 RepID=A0A0V0QFT5_PSEPJ|nr:hypothetical protein PPERSA_00819 [Pseudocohnilembus persalinus]|eukprot:KRX01071.1 hypothetical protein PPERSA_00819 [Pseudocohnilembus persalinus]
MIYSIEDKDYQLLVDNLTIENQYLKKQVGQPGKNYNAGNKIDSNLDDQDYRYTTRNDQELHHLKLQNQDYQDEIATLRKRLRTFHEQSPVLLQINFNYIFILNNNFELYIYTKQQF